MVDCPDASRPPARRPTTRGGFSLVELLIVVVMMSVLVALGMPKLGAVRGAQQVQAARAEVASTVEAARSAAIQRGVSARVVTRGNTLIAIADDTVGGFRVVQTAELDREYGVTLTVATPADTEVRFDGRGLANPRLGRLARWVVRVQSGQADSVCVTNVGLLLPRGCTR
jgi:type IV fimbrial biogenesis protein FimT